MPIRSEKFGLRRPVDSDVPDFPSAMKDFTDDIEGVLTSTVDSVNEVAPKKVPDSITSLDKLTEPGNYFIQSVADAKKIDLSSYPREFQANVNGDSFSPAQAVVSVAKPNTNFAFQILRAYIGRKTRVWVRQTGVYNSLGTWTPWESVAFRSDLPKVPSNAELLEELGPAITASAKEAVANASIEAAKGDIAVFDARYPRIDDGTNNVVFGKDSLKLREYPATRNNTAIGLRVLTNMRKGRYNDFLGLEAGYSLDGEGHDESSGRASRNSGFGSNTQRFNLTGRNNVSMGRNALQCNVTGDNNTYLGAGAAAGLAHMRPSDGRIVNQLPMSVSNNVGVGTASHRFGLGSNNTALGAYSLSTIKTGDRNVAVGFEALANLGGDVGYNGGAKIPLAANLRWDNVPYSLAADGAMTLTLPEGHGLALGEMLQIAFPAETWENQFYAITQAGSTRVVLTTENSGLEKQGSLTVVERYSTDSGAPSSNNVGIGYRAGMFMRDGKPAITANNAVAIGAEARIYGDNSVTIGGPGQTVYTQVPIQTISDARDKVEVEDLDLGLSFVRKLRPVTYRFDMRTAYFGDEPDGSQKTDARYTGLIAQEVKEAGEFTGINEDGEYMSLSYMELIPVLINSIKEMSDKIDSLEKGR